MCLFPPFHQRPFWKLRYAGVTSRAYSSSASACFRDQLNTQGKCSSQQGCTSVTDTIWPARFETTGKFTLFAKKHKKMICKIATIRLLCGSCKVCACCNVLYNKYTLAIAQHLLLLNKAGVVYITFRLLYLTNKAGNTPVCFCK